MERQLLQNASIDYLSRMAVRRGPTAVHYLSLDLHLEQIQRALHTVPELAAAWPVWKEDLFHNVEAQTSLLADVLAFGRGACSPNQLTAKVLSAPKSREARSNGQNLSREARRWNDYLLQTPLFQAWCDRAEQLKRAVKSALQSRETCRLLYMRCGHGIDLMHLFQDIDPWRLEVLAVEPCAISRAELSANCAPYADDITLSDGSDAAMRKKGTFDLIWLPWCLEWHNPVLVEERLRPLLPCLKPGGSLILQHLQHEARYQAALDVLGRPGLRPPELSETSSMMQVLLGANTGLHLEVRQRGCDWVLICRRDEIS